MPVTLKPITLGELKFATRWRAIHEVHGTIFQFEDDIGHVHGQYQIANPISPAPLGTLGAIRVANKWNWVVVSDGPEREDMLAADVLAMCKQREWSLHWTARGAYLHLEASELIEALRGKRGDPLSEAADVLLVLMSITENAGLQWSKVVDKARETCDRLVTKPRYAGEEFGTLNVPQKRDSEVAAPAQSARRYGRGKK